MPTLHRPQVPLRGHQQVRLNVQTTGGPLYPSNWEGRRGSYHTVHVLDGTLVYRTSESGGPPFDLERELVTGTLLAPRVLEDARFRVWVVYGEETGEEAFDVKLLFSDDGGDSWSDPEVAIPGGKWPVVAAGDDGSLLFAAWVEGAVQGYLKHPLDDGPQTPVAWQEWNGTSLVPLVLEDTTFGVQQEAASAARWWLHCQRAGESETVNLWSTDTVTWREEA